MVGSTAPSALTPASESILLYLPFNLSYILGILPDFLYASKSLLAKLVEVAPGWSYASSSGAGRVAEPSGRALWPAITGPT